MHNAYSVIPNHVAQRAVYYSAVEVRIDSVVIPLLICG